MSLKDRFDKYMDEDLKFEDCTRKYVQRADLNGMLILNSVEIPRNRNYILSAAEHDVVYFSFDPSCLDNVEDGVILDLMRCGIYYNEEHDSLYMFV